MGRIDEVVMKMYNATVEARAQADIDIGILMDRILEYQAKYEELEKRYNELLDRGLSHEQDQSGR